MPESCAVLLVGGEELRRTVHAADGLLELAPMPIRPQPPMHTEMAPQPLPKKR